MSELANDPAQMGLTEYDQVVETFQSDRADQSLRVPPARAAAAMATPMARCLTPDFLVFRRGKPD